MTPDAEVEPPNVVLFRSCGDPDRYLRAFAEADLRAVCEPVLSFTFPNQPALASHLERQNHYSALIATSPRVARALGHVFDERPLLRTKWEGVPAYAVGPKTAASLRDVGLRPAGAEAGSAQALAQRIVGEEPDEPLLFLCGNRRRDQLPDRLTTANVAFDELIVYETDTRHDVTLPPPDRGIWLVFFSPSGIEAVEKSGCDSGTGLPGYRIAAIGPTTGGELAAAGYFVEAIASEPSPKGVVTAITGADDG